MARARRRHLHGRVRGMAHQGPGGPRKPVKMVPSAGVGTCFAARADGTGGRDQQPALQHGHADRGLRHRRAAGAAGHAPDIRQIPGRVCGAPALLVRTGPGESHHAVHAAGRARVLSQHLPHCLPAEGPLDAGHRPARLAASGLDRIVRHPLPAVPRPQGPGHVLHRHPGLSVAGELLPVLSGRPLRLVDRVLPLVLPTRRLAGDADVAQRRRAAAARGPAHVFRGQYVRLGARRAVRSAHDRRQLHQRHGGARVETVHRPSHHGQAAGLGQDHARLPIHRPAGATAPAPGRTAAVVAGHRRGQAGAGAGDPGARQETAGHHPA